MNLVGKIFTVLIFVLSLVFMVMAMMVYAAHKNWRLAVDNPNPTSIAPLGLKQRLDQEKNTSAKLKEERDRLDAEKSRELQRKTESLATLETEVAQLKEERVRQEQELAKKVNELRQATAVATAALAEAKKWGDEVVGLRTAKLQAEQDRDKHFAAVVQLTDTKQQLENDLKALEDLERVLSTGTFLHPGCPHQSRASSPWRFPRRVR